MNKVRNTFCKKDKEMKGFKITDLLFWRSQTAMFSLATLLLIWFLYGQAVTVVPYENMHRDFIIFNVMIGSGFIICISFGIRAKILKKKELQNQKVDHISDSANAV